MPKPQTRYALYFTIAVLGVHAQIAQALLAREGLVAFYGNELSLGAFYGGWLWWLALGSLLAVRWRARPWVTRPLPLLRALVLALPLLLLGQTLLLRGVRLLLDVSPSEFIPLGQMVLALLLATLPSGLALGLAFPLACRALRPAPSADADLRGSVAGVSYLYVFDALGALLGGLLFTFVLVEWVGPWRSLGLTALLLALCSLLLGGSRGGRWWAGLLASCGLLLAASPAGGWFGTQMEALRFASLQPGLELETALETRYGHLALGRTGSQFSLVENGRIGESFPDPQGVQQDAAYVFAQAPDAERLLLFGGLSGGLVAELLRYPLQRLDLVLQDRLAFERVRPWLEPASQEALEDPRLHLYFGDGRRYVNALPDDAGYDLVLVLHADPGSAQGNRYFTQEFYRRMAAAMDPGGVLCTAVSSASNYLGREVKSYSGSLFRTLGETFPEIAIAPGDRHLYCAARLPSRVSEDPGLLELRYRDLPLDEHRFPALSFHSLLPAERVAFVRDQLTAEEGELNRDGRPVTYYLNTLLWGRFTASALVDWLQRLRALGPWPYLVPLAVGVALMLLHASLRGPSPARRRRSAAVLALALLGLISMALQLALLFAYQAQIGFVFSRLALLNGLFMTGLALGAGLIGQQLARRREPGLLLALLLGLLAAGLLALPGWLNDLEGLGLQARELAYLGLCLLTGLITGAGFPLGLRQAHADTGELVGSSGLAEAADSLGGALGGLLTGALLVPLLGIEGTCRVLAAAALVGLLPLLHARFAPERLPRLQARSFVSFPYSWLSWSLAWLLLCGLLLTSLGRSTVPDPPLYFDAEVLAQVAGNERFELSEAPMPHYLGVGSDGAPASLALASGAVKPRPQGYAGPLDLLIGLDPDGRLLGVRYLASKETAAYIAGIQDWLDGLAGTELAAAPLDLERVDALSGATLSSRAALETVNRAAAAGVRAAFGRELAASEPAVPVWSSQEFLVTLGLLALFFPVYLSGRESARLAYQALVLLAFGFWLNSLVTEIDLVNLSLGQFAGPAENPTRWLLLGFVLLVTLAFGQVWCGYCCPFGALQEFLSRLGRRLYLRRYVERPLDLRLRLLKYLLLAALLTAVWLGGDSLWAGFNPMQHLFGGRLGGWMLALAGLSLGGALVYYRFWCRYFCPLGALLSLGNKLALLGRLAPKRRFEHCDLGVRHEYDVDCIRCSRCLSGRDFGQRDR